VKNKVGVLVYITHILPSMIAAAMPRAVFITNSTYFLKAHREWRIAQAEIEIAATQIPNEDVEVSKVKTNQIAMDVSPRADVAIEDSNR
jgi:hypothetical protein